MRQVSFNHKQVMAGRPKEDLSTLPNGWYNDVLALYRIGASDEEIKAHIYELRGSFSNDLWDRWLTEEEEFSETIKTGRVLAAAWWNKQGRVHLKDGSFNYTGWYMQMKNRFGWKDKQATELTGKDGKDAFEGITVNVIRTVKDAS
jgi:hypothetical protein